MEHLITPEIIVPLAVFAMPVALLWIKKHYAALEKGLIKPGGQVESNNARVEQLEKQNQELLLRVQNLESIVCALDEAPRAKTLAAPAKMTLGD
jgi:hypothetical protein